MFIDIKILFNTTPIWQNAIPPNPMYTCDGGYLANYLNPAQHQYIKLPEQILMYTVTTKYTITLHNKPTI